MRYNSKIHDKNHFIKNILGNLEFFLNDPAKSKNDLLVVNYHGTEKKFLTNFEKQLVFLKETYHIIAPQELHLFYESDWKKEKQSLLLTFDDGIKNNIYALDILEKHKLKAFFFIIPGFVDTPVDQQKGFFLKNIRPIINTEIDSQTEDFLSLSWEEIKKIAAAGHSIGSHTYSHTLVKNSSDEVGQKEIAESKHLIEKNLHLKIDSYCSINNTLLSTGSSEKKIIHSNYKFHFTTFPGLNSKNRNPLFIKRRNIECFWLLGTIKFALGNWDLRRWKAGIETFDKL